MSRATDLERARAIVDEHEARVVAADPDARRRAGRYYTPPSIVRLLARRVLDPLVARAATVEGILALRVLDPACGAGAFLLGTLEVLADALVTRGLAPEEARRRVVEECLLGLDTDAAAIDRAREALALASGGARAHGVRVGDALADHGLGGEARVSRLDAVLGNPPYRREKDGRGELARARATALGARWGTGKMDLWFLFAHAALEALPVGGRHGFVVSAYWLESAGAARLREHMGRALRIELLVDLGARPFFAGVSGRHVVYVGERVAEGTAEGALERVELTTASNEGELAPDLEDALVLGRPHAGLVRRVVAAGEVRCADGTFARGSALARRAALVEAAGTTAEIVVGEGVTPGPEAWTASVARRAAAALGTTAEQLEGERGIGRGEGVFVLTRAEVARARLEGAPELRPWVAPSEVPAYPAVPEASSAILYLARTAEEGRSPSARVLAHLERFRPALDRRRETRDGGRPWFELHWPRDPALFQGPRVLLPRMVERPRAAFVEEPLVVGESVLVLRFPDRERTRLAAALLGTEPLACWLLERGKRRGVGIDVSVALARAIPWPRALVAGDLGAVEPVARALEAGERARADELAWRLYGRGS